MEEGATKGSAKQVERRKVALICVDCGGEFLAVRSNAQRCPACGKRRNSRLHEAKRPPRVKNPGVGKGNYPRIANQRCVCKRCFTVFYAQRSDAKWCPECAPAAYAGRFKRFEETHQDPCPDCGAPKHRHAKYCKLCANKHRGRSEQGPGNPNWKGGVTESKGYRLIRKPRGKSVYPLEHIAVWEAANGSVPQGWHVHHLNGTKDDNRLENLIAMSASDHHSNRGLVPYEERIRQLEQRLRDAGLPIN